MTLTSLRLQSFRCFKQNQFEFAHRFNFINGKNGVGKTALLEAISLLSVGRSFRTRETTPLIHGDHPDFTIFASLNGGHTLSIQKSRSSSTQIQINDQACHRTSELAAFLPSQIIYQDLFQIIDSGPSSRRQVIDWGMFHVKQHYHEYLKKYQQALKQRNTLLKQRANSTQLISWNQTLNQLAMWIHAARTAYFNALYPLFTRILSQLGDFKCSIIYLKGWDNEEQGLSLLDVLIKTYQSDIQRQYTLNGPHHADFEIRSDEGKAKLYLSRGQQKIVLLALKLAQAQLMDKPCVYIWDDVCSELDEPHLLRLRALIQEIKGQFFISGVNVVESGLFVAENSQVIDL